MSDTVVVVGVGLTYAMREHGEPPPPQMLFLLESGLEVDADRLHEYRIVFQPRTDRNYPWLLTPGNWWLIESGWIEEIE